MKQLPLLCAQPPVPESRRRISLGAVSSSLVVAVFQYFNVPCSVSSKPSSPVLHSQLGLAALGMQAACAEMDDFSAPFPFRELGSRKSVSKSQLSQDSPRGGHWALLSVGVFVSQVKKLKGGGICTQSISRDAQTLHACPTGFIVFVKVQESSFAEGVFRLCITGALGSSCRVLTIVTCPLPDLTVWKLNKPSPRGHRKP